MLKRSVPIIILLATILLVPVARATHIRAGEITIERKNCQSLTFIFYITGYVDLVTGQVTFGGGTLDFGDGTEPIEIIRGDPRVEILLDEVDLGGGNGVGVTRFRVEHTYSSNGTYIVTYVEPNRNKDILNMDNSVNTPFYVESVLRIDPFLGCNNSPVMLIPPIDFGCVGVAFYHNPGAFDQDGDSLAFEFVTPRKAVGTPVDNYRPINDPSFNGTPENGQGGPATFTIDAITGDIIWDAPGLAGEYNIAFVVREYRKVQGQWFLMGTVVRDMQIIIDDCDNNRPELDIPDDLCVEAGTNIQEVIRAIDKDGDDVKIEVLSAVLHFPESPATFIPDPPVFQSQPGQLLFEWQTTCEHIREQPYLVHFKVTDKPDQGVSLVEFATLNITVVAPPPLGLSNQVNNDRTIDLTWDPYLCSNADSIQIWRRIDEFSIQPDVCDVGMPDAGYTLIDKVSSTVTSYKDDNNGKKLAFGANYCYRLVAQFPAPRGGESYVSAESCGTIKADGPIITHVTVDETSIDSGKITVSWRRPFEIDQALFPPPYNFELWRGEGISGEVADRIMDLAADTTFQITGLNTLEKRFHFLVKLFDGTGNEVRLSVKASQVNLEPTSLVSKIELNWSADVPWTNNSQDFPMHYIYRDNVIASNPSQLVLIDSVNVNENGYFYADDGSFNNTPLDDLIEYSYYVAAYGTYGNPKILAPQINLSQIVKAQPNDTIPPKAPNLSLEIIDCESYLQDKDCDFSSYFNILHWQKDLEDDLKQYRIYFSESGAEGTFELIDSVKTDTTYLHTGINSFKGCYYITSIDRSNLESEPSEIVCNDNCPYYELPNIFTPNGDWVNDTFRPLDQYSDSPNAQCPRFVESVHFSVYNRWGVLLYEYQSGGENSIYINWDGRDSLGTLVPAGNYYYSAVVVFNVRNEAEQEKTLNGWVQVLY
jgi:gliding motility-associated-like protein